METDTETGEKEGARIETSSKRVIISEEGEDSTLKAVKTLNRKDMLFHVIRNNNKGYDKFQSINSKYIL